MHVAKNKYSVFKASVLLCLILLCLVTSCHQPPCYWPPPPLPREISAEKQEFREVYTQALVEREAGNYEDMYVLLQRALQLRPDMGDALYDMAKLKYTLAATGDSLFDARTLAEGDSLLRLAVRYTPEVALYKRDLAQAEVREGNYMTAVRLYEDLVKSKPRAEDLRYLSYLYSQQDDYDGAYRAVERLEELEGSSFQTTFRKVQLCLERGDTVRASELAATRVQEEPFETESQLLYATMQLMCHDTLRALSILDDVVEKDPGNAMAQRMALSLAHSTSGAESYDRLMRRFAVHPATEEEQRVQYLYAIADNGVKQPDGFGGLDTVLVQVAALPGVSDVLRNEVTRLTNLAPFASDKKRAVYREMLRAAPDFKPVRYIYIYELSKLPDSSQDILQQCLEGIAHDSTELLLYQYAGQAYFQLDCNAEAIALLEHCGAVAGSMDVFDKEQLGDNLALLGDIYHAEGDDPKAFATYERALRYNPGNALCCNNYAYFLALRGERLDEAEELSRRAVEKEDNSSDPVYLDTYAYVLYANGKYEQAKIYITEAIQHLDGTANDLSGRAVYYEHAGDIAAALHETDAARTYWKEALDRSDNADDVKRIEKKLRTLR